jgi:hypothetical protein
MTSTMGTAWYRLAAVPRASARIGTASLTSCQAKQVSELTPMVFTRRRSPRDDPRPPSGGTGPRQPLKDGTSHRTTQRSPADADLRKRPSASRARVGAFIPVQVSVLGPVACTGGRSRSGFRAADNEPTAGRSRGRSFPTAGRRPGSL